ncbi:hypothetical protein EDC01DRAFT_776863 [Geopyxis carbonaria]|nr:hypothetical protein EDC01DRAFT_776863 [Geopyxis carbonaria]
MSGVGSAASQAGRLGFRSALRRDPELYVLLGLMTSAFTLVGFYFGRNPTMAHSEEGRINMAAHSAPWNASDAELAEDDGRDYKYKYHPGANYRNAPKKAPGALHSVVVPSVTVSREVHERFNKYGREEFA